MPETPTEAKLRGLVLSATELKELSGWPSALVEDYLNIIDNILTISQDVGIVIDTDLEDIPTNFLDGTIPVVLSGKLVSDVANFMWDIGNKILNVDGIISSSGRRKSQAYVTTSPYAVNPTEEEIYVNTNVIPIILNLPPGTTGEHHKIINTGTSGNDVEVSPNGAEVLYGVNASEFLRDLENVDIGFNPVAGWA